MLEIGFAPEVVGPEDIKMGEGMIVMERDREGLSEKRQRAEYNLKALRELNSATPRSPRVAWSATRRRDLRRLTPDNMPSPAS